MERYHEIRNDYGSIMVEGILKGHGYFLEMFNGETLESVLVRVRDWGALEFSVLDAKNRYHEYEVERGYGQVGVRVKEGTGKGLLVCIKHEQFYQEAV